MTQANVDPFGTTAPDPDSRDEFDDGGQGFLRAKSFVDCTVLIFVTGPMGTRPSKNAGQPAYPWCQVDVAVLDGPPTTLAELGGRGTVCDGVQLTGAGLIPELRGKLGPDGKPKERNMLLGRMVSFKSSVNEDVKGYRLAEPTDADRELARQFLAARKARLEAARNAAAAADPFGVPV